jgi:hypothetical protein
VKNRLKVLRAERDWSQADLAQRLDVSRQSVNAIETGKYDPTFIGPVGVAWGNYLTSTVGPHKVMYAHCTEGTSAAARTAWENDSKRTGFAHIVKVDWQYKP